MFILFFISFSSYSLCAISRILLQVFWWDLLLALSGNLQAFNSINSNFYITFTIIIIISQQHIVDNLFFIISTQSLFSLPFNTLCIFFFTVGHSFSSLMILDIVCVCVCAGHLRIFFFSSEQLSFFLFFSLISWIWLNFYQVFLFIIHVVFSLYYISFCLFFYLI